MSWLVFHFWVHLAAACTIDGRGGKSGSRETNLEAIKTTRQEIMAAWIKWIIREVMRNRESVS